MANDKWKMENGKWKMKKVITPQNYCGSAYDNGSDSFLNVCKRLI